MRAAILLSVMFLICGVAALFGVPAVWVNYKPITGLAGLGLSLVWAALPPLVVLGWRRWKRR